MSIAVSPLHAEYCLHALIDKVSDKKRGCLSHKVTLFFCPSFFLSEIFLEYETYALGC